MTDDTAKVSALNLEPITVHMTAADGESATYKGHWQRLPDGRARTTVGVLTDDVVTDAAGNKWKIVSHETRFTDTGMVQVCTLVEA